MPYISSSGEMLQSQSPWRLSAIPQLFWDIINFIVLFFQTMFNPSKNSKGDRYSSDHRRPGDGGGGPRRRMGGFNGGRGAPGPPPMAGGG